MTLPKRSEPQLADLINARQLWGYVRAQGTDNDILIISYYSMFEKIPQSRLVFEEAGLFDDDMEISPRMIALAREVSNGIKLMIDLMMVDEEGLDHYIDDMVIWHMNMTSFNVFYFELFANFIMATLRNNLRNLFPFDKYESFARFLSCVSYNFKDTYRRIKTERRSMASQHERHLQEMNNKRRLSLHGRISIFIGNATNEMKGFGHRYTNHPHSNRSDPASLSGSKSTAKSNIVIPHSHLHSEACATTSTQAFRDADATTMPDMNVESDVDSGH